MKNLHHYLSLLLLAALLGCATPEQTAYRTIGVITASVDGAMNGWGDYVRSGAATADEQARVRQAYERYQATMRLARIAVTTQKTQPAGASTLDTALNTAQAASGQLIAVIQQFLQPKGFQP
jgi:hypothetical protein